MNVVNYALQFVGNPYVYGGTSLTNGTDCSGFTMRVYEHFGYYIPRTAAAQMQGLPSVDLSAIQPGDLLFYRDSSGGIGHVTMYIGGGQVVHASSSTTGIIISSVGYRTPCGAARIIWD
jgi:cell wall-associated NlpC family hydrolase